MTKETENGELFAGYLDVKLPARRRRFGSWKSWRRHWVEARRSASDTGDSGQPLGVAAGPAIELVLYPGRQPRQPWQSTETAIIRVSPGTAVCRTTSRSRSHAFVLAAAADLGGEVYLAARSELDMERWMTVLKSIPSHAHAPRQRVANPASAALLRGRRLSRSEGDLLGIGLMPGGDDCQRLPSLAADGDTHARPRADTSTHTLSPLSTLGTLRQPFRLLNGRRRAETLRADTLCLSTSPQSTSGSALSLLGGKIASGLISAGLGLMLSTPGNSEVEDNDLEEDDPEPDHPTALVNSLDKRRESGVSVASGIYEEIQDVPLTPVPPVIIDRLYENAAAAASVAGGRRSSGCESHYEDPALLFSPNGSGAVELPHLPSVHVSPPPLPPRQTLTPITELLTRHVSCDPTAAVQVDQAVSIYDSLDANGYVQMDLLRGIRAPSLVTVTKCVDSKDTEPAYLPMSPIRPVTYDSHKSS